MSENLNKATWPTTPFGDVVRLNTDRVADPAAAGIERYVGIEHITPEDLRVRRWGLVAEGTTFTNQFRPGQVLFPKRRAYQRKVAVADFEGVCSGDIYVFESKDPAVLLPELLPFICQTDGFFEHAVGTSAGSLSPRTNWSQLAAYEFPLPPPTEQRRLVEVLEAIESLSSDLLVLREKAQVLWRSQSSNEFDNRPDSKVEKLSQHYCMLSGQVDPREDKYADLPLIAPNHIESGTGKLLKLETARDQGAISGKYFFEAGAVIYSKIRPNLVKATISPVQGLCSADMYPLIPRSSIRNEYLLEILLSDRFTQFAVSGSMRTGIPKLNREHLAQYECRIPTLAEQDAYLAITLELKSVAQSVTWRINDLIKVKSTLMQELSDNGI